MANKETTVLEGNLNAAGLKIAVVCARFNEFFVSKLFSGAVDAVVRHGGDRANVTQVWVPGSFELPFAVSKLAKSGKYDAVVALGVVIQGATAHASTIYSQVSKSLAAGKGGPHLEMTVASRVFSRAAAPVWGVS